MDNLQIFNIGGVDCYEKDGTAYLKLEAVARGLGFTTTRIIDGTEYVNVRWKRVEYCLKEIGFATSGKKQSLFLKISSIALQRKQITKRQKGFKPL